MDFTRQHSLRITCAPHLAPFVADELAALGLPVHGSDRTGVATAGSLLDAMRLNLHLRTGLYVLVELDAFTCRTLDELYRRVVGLPWEDVIDPDGYVSVTSRVSTPSVTNTMTPNLKMKDAIVDRIRRKRGRRPDSGPERRGVVISLHWKGRDATIHLNTTGVKLSDRGYRRLPHRAPMQEALAAAVVQATGWAGSTPLVVPMCGSGTIAVEAALIALDRAPGVLRDDFAFTHVRGFDRRAWESMRREARARAKRDLPVPILASDVDPEAVEAARTNAATAGVARHIQFETCDFADTPLPDEPGVVILHPPYGARLGDAHALADTYSRMGDFLKQRCPGWTGWIFTCNADLAKKVGLRAGRRIPFANADLDCRLLRYDLYAGTRSRARSADEHAEGASRSSTGQ